MITRGILITLESAIKRTVGLNVLEISGSMVMHSASQRRVFRTRAGKPSCAHTTRTGEA